MSMAYFRFHHSSGSMRPAKYPSCTKLILRSCLSSRLNNGRKSPRRRPVDREEEDTSACAEGAIGPSGLISSHEITPLPSGGSPPQNGRVAVFPRETFADATYGTFHVSAGVAESSIRNQDGPGLREQYPMMPCHTPHHRTRRRSRPRPCARQRETSSQSAGAYRKRRRSSGRCPRLRLFKRDSTPLPRARQSRRMTAAQIPSPSPPSSLSGFRSAARRRILRSEIDRYPSSKIRRRFCRGQWKQLTPHRAESRRNAWAADTTRPSQHVTDAPPPCGRAPGICRGPHRVRPETLRLHQERRTASHAPNPASPKWSRRTGAFRRRA